jgi:hypothetical protein
MYLQSKWNFIKSQCEMYLQSNEILLNLNVKCWNLAFTAQGLRLIIVVVQVGAVKKYVTAVETQFTTNIVGGKTSLGPSLVNFHSHGGGLLCRNWLFSPP